jgi:hypothetical protein
MNRFASVLKKLSANKSALLFALVALIAYSLPWIINRSAGLSFNGYDLAEWASLNLGTRATNPPMIPSLLLRMQLTLLALLIAINAGKPLTSWLWWLCGIFTAALTIAQIPPFEFFTIHRADPNYGQQFMLTIITFIGSLIGLSGLFSRWRIPISIIIALIGIVSSIAGYLQTQDLMRAFNLSSAIGIGVIAIAVSYVVLIGVLLWRGNQKGTSEPAPS